MAFLSKFGIVSRQTASKLHIHSGPPASRYFVYQAIRFLSSSKLFVSGIPKMNDDILKESFSIYGPVVQARVITQHETGKSKGFGFVTFGNIESASKAIGALDKQNLHGRRIRVQYATDGARGTLRSGGGYGGKVYGCVVDGEDEQLEDRKSSIENKVISPPETFEKIKEEKPMKNESQGHMVKKPLNSENSIKSKRVEKEEQPMKNESRVHKVKKPPNQSNNSENSRKLKRDEKDEQPMKNKSRVHKVKKHQNQSSTNSENSRKHKRVQKGNI